MFCSHSVDEEYTKLETPGRDDTRASQIMYLNISTAMTDVYLPREEMTFQVVKASG